MRKKIKIVLIIILMLLINIIIFGYVYLKNNISVSLYLTGNNLTSNNDIFEKFEKRTDIFYWYIKRDEIEKNIESLPYVKKVEIYPESFKNFYKITIRIIEEVPYYLSKLKDGKIEVISKSGKKLSIFNKRDFFEGNKKSFKFLPVVSGLDSSIDSSQIMASRLLYISNLIEKLSKNLKYTLHAIDYLPSGDVVLYFDELTSSVIIDASKSDEFLQTQIDRFKALEKKFGKRLNTFSKIDLAFKKVGILEK